MPGRFLFVHAHPDDESITTGATLAALVAEGHEVTVVTATRGEGGEVIGTELAALEGDRAALARHREGELASALSVLGVTDHRFLGDIPGGRRFEDSGMRWSDSGLAVAAEESSTASLVASPQGEAAYYLSRLILERRPHVVVTYGPGGGYGHPDHSRTHDEVLLAVDRAARQGWATPRVAYVEEPQGYARERFDPRQPGFADTGFAAAQGPLPIAPASGEADIEPDLSRWRDAKTEAMSRHRSQIRVSGSFFALSNGIGQRIPEREFFRVAVGPSVPRVPASGLLDGLDAAALDASGGGQKRAREPKPPSTAYIIAHSVVLTLLVGVIGTFQHLSASMVMGVMVPWGLLLGLLLVFAAQWHLGMTYKKVYPMMIVGFGVSTIAYLLAQVALAPNADLVVTGTLRSLAWLFVPVLISGVLAFTMPRRFARAQARESYRAAAVPRAH